MRQPGLLVEIEIRRLCRDALLPHRLVLLHRVSADIKTQHFLLKAQQQLLLIFPDIGHPDLQLLLVLLRDDVKQRHLPCRHAALAVHGAVEDRRVDAHVLLSGRAKTVKGTRLDKILDGALIHLDMLCPLDKIFEILVISMRLPLLDDAFDDRPAHALDRVERVADRAV